MLALLQVHKAIAMYDNIYPNYYSICYAKNCQHHKT